MKKLLLVALCAMAFVGGCGVGGSAPPVITVTLSPATAQSIDQGQTVSFTVVVANDSGSKGVTWTVSGTACTGTACGTLTNVTITSVTYTAPTAVSSNLAATVTATSVADTTKTASAMVTVTPLPAITTTSLANGTVGTAYSATLQESGGVQPFTWSVVTGTLPAGLTLNASTGAITGTPTNPGTSTFTVKVADSGSPAQSVTKQLSLTINPAPLVVTTTTLPSGTVNATYSGTLQSTGGTGTVTWTVTAGTLPAGLALAPTGQITGTPTTAGTSNFTVQATDSGTPAQMATKALSITVNPVLSITTTTVPNGTVGTAYSATLQSNGGTAPITWTVTIGTLPPGLILNSSTGAITGTPTAAGTFNFSVQASDASTPQQTATKALSITISPAPLTITTSSLPNGTVGTAYNATLQSSGGTPPVTWTVTVGALPAGLVLNSSTGAITGSPTTTGTTNFTVKATDSTTPTAQTATQALSITINASVPACGSGSESLLNGQYAFVLRGFDASGPVGIGGTFDADGAGHVAKLVGLEDINSSGPSGVQNLSINSASSSYSVGSDHRGCLTIATSAATQTFRFSLGAISSGVASNGHIIQFDSTGSHTAGVLRKQNSAAFSTAQISGSYVFGASGSRVAGGKFAVVGLLVLSGGVVQAGSVADSNDNGTVDNNGTVYPVSPIPISSGSYAIAANGRGTLSVLPTGSSTVHIILYVVSSSEVLILSSDPQATVNLFVGSALQQSGGPFANSSLNATTVLYASGLGNSGVTRVSKILAGLFTPTPGSGTFSFSSQQNSGGTISPQSTTGTYSVASNGRVTFAGGGGGAPPIFYLVSANTGFVLFTDGSLTSPNVISGFLEMQTGGPFSASSANGTYAFGTIQPEDSSVSDEAGFAKFDGAGNVSGTSDSNQAGTLNPGNLFAQTYSIDATGLGVIPANCTIGTTCQTIFFVISPTKAAVFDVKPSTTPTHPNLQIGEQ